mgnify:CR=1 FL=1
MAVSKVSKKGLTSIPAKVRRALNIEEGDLLVWEVSEERGVAVVRVIKSPVEYLRGKYDDPELTYDRVEEVSEELLARELHAGDGARHADSVRQ